MSNFGKPLGRRIVPILTVAVIVAATIFAACSAAAAVPPRTIALETLNDSGVTGTVAFSDMGGRTRVDVTVDPSGNPDMPAHIHRNGTSTKVVAASIAELFAGGLAVNIHKSNDDLKTYTACVDIR